MKLVLVVLFWISTLCAQTSIQFGIESVRGDIGLILMPYRFDLLPQGLPGMYPGNTPPFVIAEIRTTDPYTQSFHVTIQYRNDNGEVTARSVRIERNTKATYTDLLLWLDSRSLLNIAIEEEKPSEVFSQIN